VIIPATDDPPTLTTVLASIRGSTDPPQQVIVVDTPPNLGPAAARNAGAGDAIGDVLVFVDADVEVHADAFQRIRSAFRQHAGLAAVFGSYDDQPQANGVVSEFRNLLHHHVHQEGAGEAITFWAGLGAIRREVFFDLGGFDEQRFRHPSVEDIELGMRLHESGGRILLDPSIQGKHLKRWTFLTMTQTDLMRRGVPWLRLVLERRTTLGALNLGPQHLAATGISVVLLGALLRRNGRLTFTLLALLVILDRRFYALLMRRRGPAIAAAGLPLHVAHRLISAAAVPIALAHHITGRKRPDRGARS
jgi:hypothetical protein